MTTRQRHFWEIAAWIIFGLVNMVVLATSKIMEERGGGDPGFENWQAFAWEFSSLVMILILIPAILALDRRYPLVPEKWHQRLLLHIPASIIFSTLHVTGMVYLRKVLHWAMGQDYQFGDPGWGMLYEYRKDVLTYGLILLVVYVYREILRLRGGEAQLAQKNEKTDQNDRIMISKNGIYHFLEPRDIDWIEAAGNYVEIHVDDHSHMYRGTMTQLLDRLPQPTFIRIHRSTIVNQTRIEKIKPAAGGDQWLSLRDGEVLRMSRRYKKNLTQPVREKA